MECNRDEALRAKEIAERKFNAKDIAGAQKFALKAKNLFPDLEGITQMLATLDVYLAAEARVNGESDWYAVLSINNPADEETVKKQYRKLALLLHPDKNKSIGAEGAFKLISEAWSVLSDKTRKTAFDQKRNTKGFQPKAPNTKKDSSASTNTNGFYNFANSKTSNGRGHKQSNAPSAAPPSCPKKLDTFWTSCNRCRMQYEYLRVYLNHNLLCPNCHKAFYAVETGVPSNGTSASVNWSASQQHRQKSSHNSAEHAGDTGYLYGGAGDGCDTSNFQWGAFSRSAGAASASASSSAAVQAANVVHETYEKVRREREQAQAAAKREEARTKNYASKRAANSGSYNGFPNVDWPDKRRRRCITDDLAAAYARSEAESKEHLFEGMDTNNGSALMSERVDGAFVESVKTRPNRTNSYNKEFAQLSIRNFLIERSRIEIKKKLEEWKSYAATKITIKEKPIKDKENDNGSAADAFISEASCPDKMGNAKSISKQLPGWNKSSDGHISEFNIEPFEAISIHVPDPDFYDFDKDRSERSFEADQVWATYDNEDSMPRFYVLIQKVISYKPFKLRISFLNSKTNTEFGPVKWVASGFVKTCGEFRIGRYELCDTVNIFSHRVRWEKGPRGVIKVFPAKDETWAVYKNWSPEWNELTSNDVIYKYEMVEVLDDYNEEQGISVTPLVKVAGFKTVFHRHLDPNEVRRITREEMFRFSHRVPSHLLTGEEANNAPKGCRELDPAATPVELLQVMTEIKEDEV